MINKKILEEKGIKYFITLDLYDFKDSDLKDRVPANSAHTQFNILEDTNINFEVLQSKD